MKCWELFLLRLNINCYTSLLSKTTIDNTCYYMSWTQSFKKKNYFLFITDFCATRKYIKNVIIKTITHHTQRLPKKLLFLTFTQNVDIFSICPKCWRFQCLSKMLAFLAFVHQAGKTWTLLYANLICFN